MVLAVLSPILPVVALIAGALLGSYLASLGITQLALRAMKQQTLLTSRILQAVRKPLIVLIPLIVLLDRLATLGLAETVEMEIERFLLCVLLSLGTWTSLSIATIVTQDLVQHYRSETGPGPVPQIATRISLMSTVAKVGIWFLAIGLGLLIFPEARSIGATVLASAGILGIVGGLATRPILENLIAGIQLAFAQPFRLDDLIVVNGEFGAVEEITATYVVIRCWDRRRLVYPLTYFIANPFENWTRQPTELLGSVFMYVDYSAPLTEMRIELARVLALDPRWSGSVGNIDVIDSDHPGSMKLRILVSTSSPTSLWDLRSSVHEKLLNYLQTNYPTALPYQRATLNFPG